MSASTEGVRLLPPHAPYTQLRDRDTIVDRKHHRDVWTSVGAPGALLADGKIIGTWRPRKRGRNLTIWMKAFGSVPARTRSGLKAEAEQVATVRGPMAVEVEFAEET